MVTGFSVLEIGQQQARYIGEGTPSKAKSVTENHIDANMLLRISLEKWVHGRGCYTLGSCHCQKQAVEPSGCVAKVFHQILDISPCPEIGRFVTA